MGTTTSQFYSGTKYTPASQPIAWQSIQCVAKDVRTDVTTSQQDRRFLTFGMNVNQKITYKMEKQMYIHLNGHIMTDEELDAYIQYQHSMAEWEWYSEHGKEVEKPNNEES